VINGPLRTVEDACDLLNSADVRVLGECDNNVMVLKGHVAPSIVPVLASRADREPGERP
jgi:hypothetical protein